MKRSYIIILIFVLLLISPVVAGDLTAGSISSTSKTSVNISAGDMTFTDKLSGVSIKTQTLINDVLFKPTTSTTDKGEIIFTTSEKDPIAVFKYSYNGDQVKETIILKEDTKLSFPIIIPKGSKMISWFNDEWKIINDTNGNSMDGLVALKPYGIDAAGRYIDMKYTFDGTSLLLNYNRTISIYNMSLTFGGNKSEDIKLTGKEIPQYDYFNITYPLNIDPTWVSYSGHYQTDYGSYIIEMWNVSGSVNWTSPSYISSIEYLVIGGGGGGGGFNGPGGGGGGGGFVNGTISVTPGRIYNISVGNGGSLARLTYGGNSGRNSSVINNTDSISIIANGGGGAGGFTTLPLPGGSGGGAGSNSASIFSGGNGTSGQGYNGGSSGTTNYATGGGGGAGANGSNAYLSQSGKGGIGLQSSISGDMIYYAGGGGGAGTQQGAVHGAGGLGGGGNGSPSPGGNPVPAGTNGLGGGGGGGHAGTGGVGGTGTVIIKYLKLPDTTSFIINTTSGYYSVPVLFNETSTFTPTTWQWNATNVTGNNTPFTISTNQNDTYTFPIGNYLIQLNASNSTYYNISTQNTWVNVSTGVSSFSIYVITNLYAPSSISFTDTSLPNPISWQWNATNVTGNNIPFTFSTSQYPTYAFSPGNYSIKLNSTNSVESLVSTQTTFINVSLGTSIFTSNITSGAGSQGVLFTDTSTLKATTWQWNATNVTGNNIPFTFSIVRNGTYYFPVGNYSIILNSSNIYGYNISTQKTWINVSYGLTSFTPTLYNATNGLYPLYIQFNDTSTSLPTSWEWNATNVTGNNTPFTFSNIKNASYSFGKGNFLITLNASNNIFFNISTQKTFINTTLPDWTLSNGCWTTSNNTHTVIMWNTTGNSNWTVPDGVTTIDYLIVAGGGAGRGNGAAGNSGDGGNAGQMLNGSSSVTSGNIINVSIGGGGTGIANANGLNGTNSSFGSLVAIGGNGGINATSGASKGGIGAAGIFRNQEGGHGRNSSLLEYDIYYAGGGGGGSSVEHYGGLGGGGTGKNYYIVGTGTNGTDGLGGGGGGYSGGGSFPGYKGGSGVIIIKYITPTPTANFTSNVTIGTSYPMVVQFNDTSTNTPTIWNWSFGDGRWFNTTDSSLRNTTYQYSVAGKYNVGLTVYNSYGSNTISKVDYINLTSDNDDNLIVWTHMNGANNSIVFTSEKGIAWSVMGAAHITNSTYVFGNSSGDFTGSKSYIYTPSSSFLNFSTGAGEIEMWVKPMSSGKDVSLIKRGNPTQSSGWGVYHSTTASDSSGWVFWMGDDITGATNTFTLPIGVWSHLVISADASGNNKVYINGNLVATKSGMTANYDTNNPLYIGYRSSPVKYFDGYIDEFRISNIERWKSNFTTPYAQYNGTLETIYPDINPNSTFRYKTNPGGIAYIDNVTNGGTRNRTIQIQNITNTSYVLGSIIFNPLYVLTKSVQLNTSYYPTGMTLVSSSIDNVNGIIEFNISKPTGFSPGTDRASILDYTALYYNYTDGSNNVSEYFGYGYLINGTTQHRYPIHNFILTQVTYGDWNFTANFTADNLIPLNNNQITFTSTFTGSYPNRWNWSFGDGTFDDGTNSTTNHTYITPGLKTVTLTEYLWQNTSVSSTNTKINYITVGELSPISSFTRNATDGVYIFDVQLNDTSSNNPTSWNWTFGDGTSQNGTIQNATHSYYSGGRYTITLSAHNSNTTYDIATSYVDVWNQTYNDFYGDVLYGNVSFDVQFTDISYNATSWYWDFGDGNTSTSKSPLFRYAVPGVYTVSHSSSNAHHTYWTVKNDYITAYPKISLPVSSDFSANILSGIAPLLVNFTDLSSNTPTTWNWSFGDGNYSDEQHPSHIFNSSGNYTITLNATNTNPLFYSMTKINYIYVFDLQILSSFTANKTNGYPPLVVQFNDTSLFSPTSWNWSFGDGNYSDEQNPLYIYSYEGIYHVYFNASSVLGFNISTKTIIVSNYTFGGGSGGGSSSGTVWIDPNTILSFLVIGIPGSLMMVFLYMSGRKKDNF